MAGRKSKEQELAELVVKSLAEIEKLPARVTGMFVKVERVKRRRTLEPTQFQQELYDWIKRRGFVKWELTLGMHYAMLGGLMSRGLVYETTKDGVRGIAAR